MSDQVDIDPTPVIATKQIPIEEYAATLRLQRSLQSLHTYSNSFRTALRLFDFAGEQLSASTSDMASHVQKMIAEPDPKAASEYLDRVMTYNAWRNIACRDGAMSLYHFRKAMHYITGDSDCKTVKALIEPQHTRLAIKRFDAAFPDFEALRHAIAHQSELWKGLGGYLKNSIRGGYTKGSISVKGESGLSSMTNHRQFTMTFEGRLVAYEMSEQTFNRLIEIQNQFYAGFRKAQQALAPPDGKGDP